MGSVPKMLKPKPMPMMSNNKQVEAASLAAEERMRRRKKRGTLIATGPEGVSGEPTTLNTQLGT